MTIYHYDGASDENPGTSAARRIVQKTATNLQKPVPHIKGHGQGSTAKHGVVSAKCTRTEHCMCTMLNCTCECHKRGLL